jgi:hypothetical protein
LLLDQGPAARPGLRQCHYLIGMLSITSLWQLPFAHRERISTRWHKAAVN